MTNKQEQISIGKLFDDLLKEGHQIINKNTYDLIKCDGLKIKTKNNKFVNLKYVSRHKTSKDLIEFTISSNKNENKVVTTTDHVMMIYNKHHFFENTSAKDVHIGNYVSVYDEKTDKEYIGEIKEIRNLGQTEEYVYDCEVEDDSHSFYANNILIHNSQFSNFSCVTESWAKKYNLPKRLVEWPDEKKLELWDYAEKFVDERLTPFVRDLVREWCHTDEPDPLRYGLEYLADVGIYIAKKCYSVHKIVLEGRELADKIVYKGIELKKGNLSVEVKNILSPIFKKVLTTDYKEEDFKQYLYDSYEKFCTLNVDEISFWKGYNTEREAEGFLEMKKIVNEDGRTISTTAISAACAFYNQLLQKLNIGDKYESILLGDKVRFCYVKSNEFPIKYIAYKGRFPTEFYKYMAVDYDTMFDKTVMAPLKGLIKACKYNNIDPKKRIAESIDDW